MNAATKPSSGLATRVVTALVLAIVVIGVLYTGSKVLWGLLMMFFSLAAIWEGARLTAIKHSTIYNFYLLLLGPACLVVLIYRVTVYQIPDSWGLIALYLALAFWLLIAPIHLAQKQVAKNSPLLSAVYLSVLIAAAWYSAFALHAIGTQFLIAVVVTTVVADVTGYFVGRKFGRNKLAPAISPGKTREGAIGGLLAAGFWVCAAAAYLELTQSFAEHLLAFGVGVLLGAAAVSGDLWESLLKRQAGVKDSSQLLPGHGGVLDRIDAQLAVLPIATLLILLVKS